MPLADDRACGKAQRELIVVLLTIDGTDKADERIRAARERLGGHCFAVLQATIVDGQVRPLIGRIQYKTVRVSRQQIRIAALIGVTVDVDRRTGQVAIVRALDVAAIREAQLHLSDGSGEGSCGEPVAVVAAHLVLALAEVEVVICQVLVAQTGLGKHLAELPAVFDEGRCRLLVDLRVGSLHGYIVGSLECVGIRTMVITVLAT